MYSKVTLTSCTSCVHGVDKGCVGSLIVLYCIVMSCVFAQGNELNIREIYKKDVLISLLGTDIV